LFSNCFQKCWFTKELQFSDLMSHDSIIQW
jgi:hypothetical protein